MRLFINGTIHGHKQGSALLEEDGVITAVGREDGILSRVSSPVERIDMNGGLLTPGFQDAHMHLCHLGRLRARENLGTTKSVEEALRKTALACAARNDPVLVMEGMDQSMWPENRLPTRAELDAIEPDRPIILRRVCLHIAVANSAALERIKPEYREVNRETGELSEDVVFRIDSKIFPPSKEENRKLILDAQEYVFSLGVTTVHEIGFPPIDDIYRSLDSDGELRLRVFFFACGTPEETARRAKEGVGRNFRIAGVKAFLDGSIGGATAAVVEPYPAGGNGMLLMNPEDVEKLVCDAEACSLPVALHAIGDRAIDVALDGMEAVFGDTPSLFPHRLEHVEMLREDQAKRVKRLGILLSMQPNFQVRWGGEGGLYDGRFGMERTNRLNRTGSWLRMGIPVAFGSDGMPIDPFYGLEGAVHHPVPDERIDPEDALRCYTAEAECFVKGGGGSGLLTAGRRADMLLFEGEDTTDIPLRHENLLRTYSAGEIVFER